jgi:hypothetical protein
MVKTRNLGKIIIAIAVLLTTVQENRSNECIVPYMNNSENSVYIIIPTLRINIQCRGRLDPYRDSGRIFFSVPVSLSQNTE